MCIPPKLTDTDMIIWELIAEWLFNSNYTIVYLKGNTTLKEILEIYKKEKNL